MTGSERTGAAVGLSGKVTRFLGTFALQIAVSLAATGCGTVLVSYGSKFWHEAEAPSRTVEAPGPLAFGPDRFRAVPPESGPRVRAPYPVEFEAQFPLIGTPSPRFLASLETWSQERPCGAACATETTPSAVPVGVLPPRRPDALKVARPAPKPAAPATAVAAASAPATTVFAPKPDARVAETGSNEERVRLLGIPIPFASTGRTVVRSVASLGDSIVGLIDGTR